MCVSILRAKEHYEGLHNSCKILQMQMPYSIDELIDITKKLSADGYGRNHGFNTIREKL
jgi:branched-subunit amino acid aminotransferase/4-amino-4-deoxychorismate lyase